MLTVKEVEAKARMLEDQNYEFRAFLKRNADADELDEQFKQLHNELFANYDCCKCCNCCCACHIVVEDSEIAAIAESVGQSTESFIIEHLTKGEEGEYHLKSSPCEFLDESGRCKIQHFKPNVCKKYPHTDQPRRLSSMYSIIESAKVCPVVFEILERLKKLYRFGNKRKRN
ncbi:MAG: YkgJ family cysteine cluster protein [Holosporaceae bacterium]|jgi:Fe-S-cluster containining protein|nr:YkgJ family cysteine cluster protein [Holosporaceae bacterium]